MGWPESVDHHKTHWGRSHGFAGWDQLEEFEPTDLWFIKYPSPEGLPESQETIRPIGLTPATIFS